MAATPSVSPLEALQDIAKAGGLTDLRSSAVATHLDKVNIQDLNEFRSKFHIPSVEFEGVSEPSIYLCGNSLGLQPKSLESYVVAELESWRTHGVEGHFRGKYPWMSINEVVNDQAARLMGALPIEAVVMNSLTTNLNLLLVPFYTPTASRHKIILEGKAFPSDRYAFYNQILYHGYNPEVSLVEVFPREGETTLRTDDILQVIREHGQSVALVCFSAVQYYTGQLFDVKAITEVGHEVGAVVGFDCAHAYGNVPLSLHDDGVDFAVFCNYKYLNAGPGAIGAAFVHERHANNRDLPRFAGWWGHDKSSRFKMGPEFVPTPGAWGFQLSNPPVLQTVALLSSLEIFEEAGMARLRAKSELLTGYLEFLLSDLVGEGKVQIFTPSNPKERGCQLSLSFSLPVKAVHDYIGARRVICDMREPNVIRVAPTPLYNTFEDVYRFVALLTEALTVLNTQKDVDSQ